MGQRKFNYSLCTQLHGSVWLVGLQTIYRRMQEFPSFLYISYGVGVGEHQHL